MQPTALSAVSKGKYYWELVFSYDNSDNSGEIVHKETIKNRKTVNSKEFLSNKFNVDTGFSYKNETSASLKFEGLGEGSQKTSFGFHTDLAYELVKTSETNQTIDEEIDIEKTFTVGSHSKLNMYRLCYFMDGASIKTNTFATSPQPDIFVDLKFTCTHRILGFPDVLNLFAHTVPRVSNAVEWKTIRDNIVKYSDRNEEEQFRRFVETLSTIAPCEDNKEEWAAIRDTCGQILSDWDSTAKQLLFNKLLARFSDTRPRRHNMEEWGAIRDLSDKILNGLRPIW